MTERGRIRNIGRALVERDFSGLRWDKITPTDIDGFLDFGNRLFVFIEGKHLDTAKMSYGQRLAFERLVDACHIPPRRYSVGLLIEHDDSIPVDYANARVRSFRVAGEWRDPAYEITCRQAIDAIRVLQWNEKGDA